MTYSYGTASSEAINKVPASISALRGGDLQRLGIQSANDLGKLIPGSHTAIHHGCAIYTLRGVGLNETSIAAGPAVSIYVDEVPISIFKPCAWRNIRP